MKACTMPRPTAAAWALHTHQGARKYLNADERRRFLAAARSAPAEVHAFCAVLAFLGLRISEALSLTASQVQLADGLVAVVSLKKRDQLVVRSLPAPPALLRLLQATFGIAARQRGAASAETRLWSWGRVTAWRLVKDVLLAAGIVGPQAMPKGLRHGFGVRAVQAGVPLDLVQRWLGHADIATTAIYTRVIGPEERELARRMW